MRYTAEAKATATFSRLTLESDLLLPPHATGQSHRFLDPACKEPLGVDPDQGSKSLAPPI